MPNLLASGVHATVIPLSLPRNMDHSRTRMADLVDNAPLPKSRAVGTARCDSRYILDTVDIVHLYESECQPH